MMRTCRPDGVPDTRLSSGEYGETSVREVGGGGGLLVTK